MTHLRLITSLCLACTITACGALPVENDAAIDADQTASLEIGTGLEAYEELPNEAPTLEIVHGPQGGYHVYLSMRVAGLEPDTLLWRVVRTRDGYVFANLELSARPGTFRPIDGALERVGDWVVLTVNSPADVTMDELRVEARATSRAGVTASAMRVVRIVDDEP